MSDHDSDMPKPAAADPSKTLAELPKTPAADDDLRTLAELPELPGEGDPSLSTLAEIPGEVRAVDTSKTLAELPESLAEGDPSVSTLAEIPEEVKAVDASSTLAELPKSLAEGDPSLSTLAEIPGATKAVDASSTLAELPKSLATEDALLSTLPELPGQKARAVDLSGTVAELPGSSAKRTADLSGTVPEVPGSGTVGNRSNTVPHVYSSDDVLATIAPGLPTAEPRPTPSRSKRWIVVGIGALAVIVCGLAVLWRLPEPRGVTPKPGTERDPKLLPKTSNGPDQRMADWMRSRDGGVTLETADGHTPTSSDTAWWVVAIDLKHAPNLADMPALGGLKRLRELRLENCGLTDQAVADLPEMPTVVKLSLRGNPVGNAAVAYLSRLPGVVDLDLEGTKITDAALDTLAARPALTALDVRGTAVTRAGLKKIVDRFPTCDIRSDVPPEPKILAPTVDSDRAIALWALARKGTVALANAAKKQVKTATELPGEPFQVGAIQVAVKSAKSGPLKIPTFAELAEITRFDLTSNALTDADVAGLGSMPKLWLLRLSGPLTDAVLPSVKRYPMLRYVGLSQSRITDAGLAFVAKIGTLENLQLAESAQITDAGLNAFAGHDRLHSLDFTKCPGITDACVPTLKALPKLAELYLEGTKVTRDGAAKLTAELPRCRIVSDFGTIESKK